MKKGKAFILNIGCDTSGKTQSSPLKPKFLSWNSKEEPTAEKEEEKSRKISFVSLFRYSTRHEKWLIVLGLVSCFFGALGLPTVIMFYGEFLTFLIERKLENATTASSTLLKLFGGGNEHLIGDEEDMAGAIKDDAFAFVIGCTIGGFIQFTFSFISVLLMNYTSLQQSCRIRKFFLRAVLRQDISWFDKNDANNFANKVTEDLDKIQEGIGEKIGLFLFLMLSFVTSLIMAFIQGWKLTLVIFVCSPLIIVSVALIGKVQTNLIADELKAYGKAGSVAQEVFSSIKTVMAFGGQEKEVARFEKELESSRKAGIRRGRLTGLGGGVLWFIVYCCHSLAFWYGITLVLESRDANTYEYTPSVIIIVFFGVLAGAINMGNATPHLEAFAAAKGAASHIFNVIDRVPVIDPFSTAGKIPSDVRGEIRLSNVYFEYPARPEAKVLQGVNINVKEGEVLALVGSSGSGKSTILQLLQRLYDPSQGSVKLDGEDMKNLNVNWLRRQFGVVGQEPCLFATTIYENIRYGLESATREEVENAAKLANAHDFIMKLPRNYQTILGEGGTQISGGQKQRIAIARAVIRNPKILLLDEATSALDAASERIVQKALDRVTKGRTTVIVTHKLSNITNADRIIVLSEGRIVEEGTHNELMALEGHYYKLSEMQAALQPPTLVIPKEVIDNEVSKPAPVNVAVTPSLTKPETENVVEDIQPAPFYKIMKYNKKEWPHLLVGCISTLIIGGSLPVISLTIGELYGVLSEKDPEYMMKVTSSYCVLFLVVGVVVGLATYLQNYSFNYAGVELTSRLRTLLFSAIVRKEAGWFDEEKNGSGILSMRLSGDASTVQGAIGSQISIIFQAFSMLFIGSVISLFYSWKMTMVTLLTVPVIFLGTFLESKLVKSYRVLEKKAIENATKVAVEAITNIRTVASLGREKEVLEMYAKELVIAEKQVQAKSMLRALAFAIGQTAPFLSYGVSLWYGGVLVADEGLHYKTIFKVIEALLRGAWILAHALAYAPNVLQAKLSATRIFRILDNERRTQLDTTGKGHDWKTQGKVSLSQVKFSYPTRPETEILKGLNLNIEKGVSIALVGQSGCGKSTVIQLLQRLYDPSEGAIALDGHDVSCIDLSALRRQFGMVSQEPVLFDRTIAENIAYGDNSRTVPHCDIVAAAKAANIHDFISCLPEGYHTRLGRRGEQLSGGQKQRIAIARALVRNPQILLLDEATSALDAASEAVVQEALNAASEGRTTITVGHRPGAILQADLIFVLDNGKVVESGTHEELLRANGKYAEILCRDYYSE